MDFCMVAVTGFDKENHKAKFLGGKAKSNKYLKYAADNTFLHLDAVIWDILADMFEEWGQTEVLDWFLKQGHVTQVCQF